MIMAFMVLVLILVLLIFIFHLGKIHSQVKIPYPDRYPFIVELFYPILNLAIASGEERFRKINEYSEKYSDMVKIWFGPKHLIFVNHPDRIKKVLMSSKCSEKMNLLYKLMERDGGLISASARNHWKEHRKFFNLSFNFKIIESFLPIFVECNESLIGNLRKEAENEEFDFFEHAKRVSFDMLCATTLGINIREYQKQPIYEKIFDAYETTERAMNQKFMIPFLYPETLFKLTKMYREEQKAKSLLNEFQEDVLAKRRCELLTKHDDNKDFDDGKPERHILIDHIILNEEKFSADDVCDHILTFVSGYETWANGLAQAMLLIAMHPKVQEKLYDEIQDAIKSDGDLESSKSINKIEYLDIVLKEAYRLMPSVPLIFRQSLEVFEIEPNLVIPKDMNLAINFYVLHRRKDIWGEDANKFNPDRFLAENSTNRHQFAFLPFSAGPRMCIGYKYSNASMKVAIVKLLQSFAFRTSMTMNDIRLKSFISLKLCTPHLLSVERRSKQTQ